MKQQASATARVIAAATLLLAAQPRTAHLVAPGAAALCRQLLSANRGDRLLAWSAVSAWTRWAWRLLECCTHPGIVQHWWRRKQWLERYVRQVLAVTPGTRLLILGAGFDTLGLRLLAADPTLEVIEIDHPATQAAKQKALAGTVGPLPRFVPLDLVPDTVPTALFERSAQTLVIAEGLLMYLPVASLERLFASLCATPGSLQLLFSCISRWPDGSSGFRPRSRLVDHWLRRSGEPFT